MSGGTSDPRMLIETHQGLVRSLAIKIHRGLPPQVELADLTGYGQVGLAEAARDYRPERGVQFSTFAYYRIRGAIYDGLAKMSGFSRSQYREIRFRQMANETFASECERDPAAASRRSEDLQKEAKWLRRVTQTLSFVYLATLVGRSAEAEDSQLQDPRATEPATELAAQEIRQRLDQLIAALPRQEESLIRAVYFDGMTLQQAATQVGVSKSWASRLHARGLRRLGRSLERLGATPVAGGSPT